jgi:organic radical activating enzyme
MQERPTFKYSETFLSAQGEGHYIGHPSLWIRFHLCNLQCDGFGQDDPTNPASYDLPYEDVDLSQIKVVEELPVFSKGCDSSYTWSKRYRHLMHDRSAADICDELESLLPGGKFKHPITGNHNHMVFTGGEPMLPKSQRAMSAILKEFDARDNLPLYITVETNGTKALNDGLSDIIRTVQNRGGEWFWSVSPKLWNTAGEHAKKAIKPEVVSDYYRASSCGQLKFVVNGSKASWDEMEHNINLFRESLCEFDVWVMGVGGTLEGLVKTESDIADDCLERGYKFTTRVHCHVYGNVIGK